MDGITLDLILTHHWYDEVESGRKVIEYREMSSWWTRLIWDRRLEISRVRFRRGYTKTSITIPVVSIDIGECPYPEWNETYYRIHLDVQTQQKSYFHTY